MKTPAGRSRPVRSAPMKCWRRRRSMRWLKRAERKAEFESRYPGKRYGVGFSCVQKDFGTGAETPFARGAERGRAHHPASQRRGDGTGMSTSQSVYCAQWLGKPADEGTSRSPTGRYRRWSPAAIPLMSQEEQDKLQTNPNWTPSTVRRRAPAIRPITSRTAPAKRAPDLRSRPVAGGDGAVAGWYRRRQAAPLVGAKMRVGRRRPDGGGHVGAEPSSCWPRRLIRWAASPAAVHVQPLAGRRPISR